MGTVASIVPRKILIYFCESKVYKDVLPPTGSDEKGVYNLQGVGSKHIALAIFPSSQSYMLCYIM